MNKNNNDDLFSASLDSIDSGKRVDKYQRFKNDFQRECNATLDNAQEWVKAELPLVTDYIDAAAVKDELKLPKTSARRKHLLSALLFEKSLRESIENNHASKAAILSIHMCNHMWQAKVELHGSLPTTATLATPIAETPSNSAIETQNESHAKILNTLIEKSEKLQHDSQLQSQVQSQIKSKVQAEANNGTDIKNNGRDSNKTLSNQTINKPVTASRKRDLWEQESEKEKHNNTSSQTKKGKNKKKSGGVFSKVKSKLPLRRKINTTHAQPTESTADDSLLENPNRSSIMVNPGFSESIDDSLIRARPKASENPNESGVTVHKVLKERDHDRQTPGSNTIIMKLASGTGKKSGAKLSIPEQCQQAVNILTQQFPGYDMVAIRNMAAQKIGVSPQYIENLNILPEQS